MPALLPQDKLPFDKRRITSDERHATNCARRSLCAFLAPLGMLLRNEEVR